MKNIVKVRIFKG